MSRNTFTELTEFYTRNIQTALAEGVALEEAIETAVTALYGSDMSYRFTNLWEGETDEAVAFRETVWAINFDFIYVASADVRLTFRS